jgi:hydroxymethylglutaryl-CoA lyase
MMSTMMTGVTLCARFFDSSFGGVGGHPAKVRYGGGHTGIDLDGLLATAEYCEQVLGRELHGRVTRSGLSLTK